MNVLAIVQLVLSFANRLMGYLNEGQLLDAGRQMQNSVNFQRAAKEVERADEVAKHLRDLIDSSPGGLSGVDDGFKAG